MNTEIVNHKYGTIAKEVSEQLNTLLEENNNEIWICDTEIYNWSDRHATIRRINDRVPDGTKEVIQLVEISIFQVKKWKDKREQLANQHEVLKSLTHRAEVFNKSFEVNSLNQQIALMAGMGMKETSIVDPAKEIESLRRAVFELEGYKEIM